MRFVTSNELEVGLRILKSIPNCIGLRLFRGWSWSYHRLESMPRHEEPSTQVALSQRFTTFLNNWSKNEEPKQSSFDIARD